LAGVQEERLSNLKSINDPAYGGKVAYRVREAIRRVWLRPGAEGPVALWDGTPGRTSVDHDAIYDEP
jgi:hypothetical protein